MQKINYKDMKFNPFNLIGDEWMLVTAGDESSCNTMTASSARLPYYVRWQDREGVGKGWWVFEIIGG